MTLKCMMGHKWNGCKCLICGEVRDKGHWYMLMEDDCHEECFLCGKKQEIPHMWNGCVCSHCGKKRDEEHSYELLPGQCVMRCSICGKESETEHQMSNGICNHCGYGSPADSSLPKDRENTRYTLLLVIDCDGQELLMCKRFKEPFKGLLNLPGGKIEEGESGLAGAYRELFEETGITSHAISLVSAMKICYPADTAELEVYAGRLKHTTELKESSDPLCWVKLEGTDFSDSGQFAGSANILHMLMYIKERFGLF